MMLVEMKTTTTATQKVNRVRRDCPANDRRCAPLARNSGGECKEVDIHVRQANCFRFVAVVQSVEPAMLAVAEIYVDILAHNAR